MIPLIKSTFYNEKLTQTRLAAFIKKAKQLSFGKECESFEKEFATWQGSAHSVLLNSGSSANLAIIQALINLGRIRKGAKVGFSAVTWSTNVMPLIQLGLEPIPVDVSLDTLNVTPKSLEQVIKKHRIKLMFITNLLGFCDQMKDIVNCCRKHGVLLIEDNCESLGSVYEGKKLGSFGLAGTFSFYVGHHMSTIEGGAIVTDDEELATMIRIVRAHGWDRNLDFVKQTAIRQKFKVNSTFYSRYTFYDLGYNLRPTEITGFVGKIQLKYIQRVISLREKNFYSLAKDIYASDDYFPIQFDHMEKVSNFAFPLVCKTRKKRDTLVGACKNKVEIRPIVGGDITVQPFFRKYSPERYNCPNARLIHQNGLYFGNNPELTKNELDLLKKIFSI